jgi:hypothetical protein
MTPTIVPPRAHGRAVNFAEDQDQYNTLPAWYTDDPEGAVITRWRLTWRERLGLLVGRPLWLYVWTFGRPLQPILPTLNEPTPDPASETPDD